MRISDANSGQTFERHAPVTGHVATVAPAAGFDDVIQTVEALAAAFPF
ncbi:hypothetical protein ACS3QZ_17955 [Shimia sp. W99]